MDFVSIHQHPKSVSSDPHAREKTLDAIGKYDFGRPLLIEETCPLFGDRNTWWLIMDDSVERADGWMCFYRGKPAKKYPAGNLIRSMLNIWRSQEPIFQQRVK